MIKTFGPGARIPQSGVYRVRHGRDHAPPHEVTIVHGLVFPTCLHCIDEVRFVLLRSGENIDLNPNFRSATVRVLRT